MGKALKWLMAIAANGLLAGFFGLGCALLNLLWLEGIQKRFPAVRYQGDYVLQFGGACAILFFVLGTWRQMQTQADTIFPKVKELSFLGVFMVIAMVGLTPVPGSHFMKYLIDRQYSDYRQNPAGGTNASSLSASNVIHSVMPKYESPFSDSK